MTAPSTDENNTADNTADDEAAPDADEVVVVPLGVTINQASLQTISGTVSGPVKIKTDGTLAVQITIYRNNHVMAVRGRVHITDPDDQAALSTAMANGETAVTLEVASYSKIFWRSLQRRIRRSVRWGAAVKYLVTVSDAAGNEAESWSDSVVAP